MSDIVYRLRFGICDDPCRTRDIPSGCDCAQAAAEIDRLRAALREIASRRDYQLPSSQDIARAALGEKE